MKKINFNYLDFKLNGYSWEVNNPLANVIIFSGMEEHVSRYDYFALELNKNRYSVFALDVFGQGENVLKDLSNRGVWPIDGFNKNVDVYASFIENLNKSSQLPTFIFAHSMGSFMLQSFIQKYPNLSNKVVLCGSGNKNPAVGFAYFLEKISTRNNNRNKKSTVMAKIMFGSFNKKIDNPLTEYDWLSYNKENVDTYIKDPLCGYGPNKGFCLDFLKGMKGLYTKKGLNKIDKNINIYIIAGEEDPVAGYGKFTLALNKMYIDLGIKNVSYKLYKHARHEILNEDIKDDVIKDVLNFYR